MRIKTSVEGIRDQLISWRRDFHRYAESGFREIRTASLVAAYLEKLGYEVSAGKEVMKKEYRMGVPDVKILHSHKEWALQNGANKKWLEKVADGFTGVVGILHTHKPGPVIAYRFDMDALEIQEDLTEEHRPFREGFSSVNDGMMHACGHDGHTSIGLGLATLLKENKESLAGTIKLIFQPAEEGTRGAKSMVEAGIVDDTDYFIATHLGAGVALGEVVTGQTGFLATTKLDVVYRGKAAHAGGNPEKGRNALMAASSAVLGLYGIPRHSAGASRVNVGVLQAGSGRNVIPNQALLKIETRGATSEINEYMEEKAIAVMKGAAAMYQVDVDIEIVGSAKSGTPSPELVEVLAEIAEHSPYVKKVTRFSENPFGSEDATFFMERVQSKNGQATYMIIGTTLAAGHHHERFDYDEEVLSIAVDVLFRSAMTILSR